MEHTTSLQRTYRYLRMSVAGTVVVIGGAVLVATAKIGWLPSLSAYYYTPARNTFVGAIIAVSLALIALSGRGIPRGLLDSAGLLAPLIALVPTPIGAREVPGVPGCASRACVPPQFVPDVEDGVTNYLVIVALILLVTLALVLLRQVDFRAVAVSLGVGAAVLVTVLCSWLFARDAFLTTAHFAAASLFFLLIGFVAVVGAFP